MTITIDEDVCKKYGLTLAEVLAVLLVKTGKDVETTFASLESRMVLVRGVLANSFLVTQGWDDKVASILLDSDRDRQPQDRIEALAVKMMELFPAGKKEGTSQYFRGNKKDVSLKLKKFFKLYGNAYTDEQILDATKKYVESFNGRYNYMRVLKYFIWKNETKTDSDGVSYISEVSDLASYIENEAGIQRDKDWTATLRQYGRVKRKNYTISKREKTESTGR